LIDLQAAVSPAKLKASLEDDLSTPEYVAEIEKSRDDMFANRLHKWRDVLDEGNTT
jgi:hypothetical protein